MYNVVVADDETIVRTSITTLLNREVLGFQVIGDAVNGKGVLSIIEDNHVDVVITDIKMPIMDGIELIEQLQKREKPPLIIVLSAYNDFSLVRSAFKLGAIDYILKSHINEVVLKEAMINLKKKLDKKEDKQGFKEHANLNLMSSPEETFKDIVLGKKEIPAGYLPERYYLASFEVEAFEHHSKQFANDIQGSFVQPIINFAKQIPRVASKCIFISISPSRYILCYSCQEESYDPIISISQQIMNVWKNYMNISVSVGVSSMGRGEETFFTCLEETYNCLSMKFIFGQEKIVTPLNSKEFDVKEAIEKKGSYEMLITKIKMADNDGILKARQRFFSLIPAMTLEEGQTECLSLIYCIAIALAESGDVIWDSFHSNKDFYKEITQLQDIRDIEIWVINFIRGIVDYIEYRYNHKSMNIIEQAKAFIGDHYLDPAISLGAVAEFVDLSEKYFSTRFRKETGVSFVAYLTKLRMQKAQEMIKNTNMKIYEISEAVGYGSVEHFTRVFKKNIGTSPSTYAEGR